MEHIIFEANMTRYEILLSIYKDQHYGTDKCCMVWLNAPGGTKTYIWVKGDMIYQSYVTEKSGINSADLAGIMSFIRNNRHGLVSELRGFRDIYTEYML